MTSEMLKVALSYMEGLDCSRSLRVAILLRYNELDQVVRLKTDPHQFLVADDYHRAALATDLLRKVEDFELPGVDAERDTLAKWLWAEKECFTTNRRLFELRDFGTLNGVPAPERIIEFLDDVKSFMYWLLGSGPTVELDGCFGPGATVSDRSGRTTVLHKMSSLPTFTTSSFGYLVPWTGTRWATACAARNDVPVSTHGNHYFTVPKTALVKRPCAKEPSINAFYQRALGLQLKRRLRVRGIDLETAQDVHKRVACSSSITDEFCTIDLTSASDTVSKSLVELVTPHKWFQALDQLRSRNTFVDGHWRHLEKFSSMGNGFTFELETALFLAVCLAVDPALVPGQDLFVFGDDIIVPKKIGEDVLAALKFLGFTANVDKTFLSGNFRESCGGDYFLGSAVRGFFLENLPHDPQSWIAMANGIRRCAHTPGLRRDTLRAWHKVLDNIPDPVRRCRGPEDLGDVCIHDSQERWSTRTRSCIRWVRVYRPHRYEGTGWDRFDSEIQLAGALYGVRLKRLLPNGRPGFTRFDLKEEKFRSRGREYVIGRDSVLSYKVGWSPFS